MEDSSSKPLLLVFKILEILVQLAAPIIRYLIVYPVAPEKSVQSKAAETSVIEEAINPEGVLHGGAGVAKVEEIEKLLKFPAPQSLCN